MPKLLAIAQVTAEPERFGIEIPAIPNAPYFTRVDAGGQVDLGRVANLAGVELDELRALNPQYNRFVTAPDGPYELLVPADTEQRFQDAGLPFTARAIAGGWRLFSAPEMEAVVARLSRARKVERISPAALETLAIVAYRQPVTKAEIEAIRGVQAGPILRSLVERGLLRVALHCQRQKRVDAPGVDQVRGGHVLRPSGARCGAGPSRR